MTVIPFPFPTRKPSMKVYAVKQQDGTYTLSAVVEGLSEKQCEHFGAWFNALASAATGTQP